MTTIKLEINLSSTTMQVLKDNGYYLYLLLPVVSSNKGVVPLIWDRREYLQTTSIEVPCADIGYISTSNIARNQTITIGTPIEVSVGTALSVDQSGVVSKTLSNNPDGIYFSSKSSTFYSCGLAKMNGYPYCAAALYAGLTVSFAPKNGIFAFFMTSSYDPGTYLEASLGQGIYIVIEAGSTARASFDVNHGWTSSEVTAKTVEENANLSEVLVIPPGNNKPLF